MYRHVAGLCRRRSYQCARHAGEDIKNLAPPVNLDPVICFLLAGDYQRTAVSFDQERGRSGHWVIETIWLTSEDRIEAI